MSSPIHVCWYCEKWQPGGIQAVQVNLLEHMDLRGICFDIAVSEDDTALFDKRLEALGVRKIVTLGNRHANPISRVLANTLAFPKLLARGHYDVVHLNACHGVEYIYCFWAWLFRVPVRIVHCRNNDIGAGGRLRPVKIAAHRLCKRLFGGCATVRLANSDLAAKWLFSSADLKRNRVQLVRNGIDAQRYAFRPEVRERVRQELHLDGKFVVGHVGHFNYQKNHEQLVSIFRQILERCPNALLLLVGQGENQEKIRQLVCENGMEEHVLFYGVTEDIPALMMAMDVFLFPSRFEGFGNVLIEAQACGLPCFASARVIPKDAQITPNVTWIDLEQPEEVWAQRVLEQGLSYQRSSHVEEVVSSGHDIAHMAHTIEQLYRCNSKEEHP